MAYEGAERRHGMTDIETAFHTLKEEDLSFVICKGETIYKSQKHGVAPIVELIDNSVCLKGFSAADRVVGKGAALLFVLAGVSEIYSPIISEPAAEALKLHGIKFSCDEIVPFIINRRGDGQCPIEEAVKTTDDPANALSVIKKKLAELSSTRG